MNMPRFFRWLLIALVAANLAVGAAWLGKDSLRDAGLLAPLLQARVDLAALPLPPIVAERADPAGAPAESTTEKAELAAENNVEAVPGDAVASAPPPAEEGDKAVDSEAQADPPAASEAAAAGTESAAPSDTPPRLAACLWAGPFTDRADADALQTQVEAAGGSARIEEEAVADTSDHLVYVAPAPSREIARRTGRELTEQSIDAYVIPTGTRANGVSVGIFRSHRRAIAQRDRVAGLGYEMRLHTRNHSRVDYRLLVRDAPPAALGDAPFAPCDDEPRGVADP